MELQCLTTTLYNQLLAHRWHDPCKHTWVHASLPQAICTCLPTHAVGRALKSLFMVSLYPAVAILHPSRVVFRCLLQPHHDR
jgi:hypothetical protein